DGEGAAQKAEPVEMVPVRPRPGAGRAQPRMGLCQCGTGSREGQTCGEVRYVFGYRGRPELRTRLSDGSRDSRRSGGVPDGRPPATGRRLMASKSLRQATS